MGTRSFSWERWERGLLVAVGLPDAGKLLRPVAPIEGYLPHALTVLAAL